MNVLLALTLAAGLPSGGASRPSSAAGDGAIDLQEVGRLWAVRQAAAKTGYIRWRETVTYPAGSCTGRLVGLPSKQVVPPQDLERAVEAKLSFSGTKMNYDTQDWGWSAETGELISCRIRGVFDGSGSSQLFDFKGSDCPDGYVQKSPKHPCNNDLKLLLLIMQYRPLGVEGGFNDLRSCSIVPGTSEVQGRTCRVLRRRKGDLVEDWYMDVQRDLSVVRYDLRVKGDLSARLSAEYGRNEVVGWVPTAMEGVTMDVADKSLGLNFKCEVIEARFGEPVADAEFKIDFPVGTMVHELAENGNAAGTYLVRPGGGKRRVSENELLHYKYADLLKSKSGEAGSSRSSAWVLRSIWLGAFILAIPALVGYLRRVRGAGHRILASG